MQRRLLTWFDRHRRDLPWRQTRDPYAIWVSEVMLQQTQVATVLRYFEPFVRSFPNVAALAAAHEQDVLRHWQGLGYYRRARNLHRAARVMASSHDGKLPSDPKALRELPGIGRYMVGAILSQAFEHRLPILEANSRRLLCRFFALPGDPNRGPTERKLWQLSEALLPKKRIGDFNQALMELGALVCTPAAPSCSRCPLASMCAAKRRGLQHELPERCPGKEAVEIDEVAVAVFRRGKALLVQRPAEGRWAGLWEFPRTLVSAGQTHEAAASNWLHERVGIRVEMGKELATVKHGVTHHRITLVCLEARYQGGEAHTRHYPQVSWAGPKALASYPVCTPQRRLFDVLHRRRQRGLF